MSKIMTSLNWGKENE